MAGVSLGAPAELRFMPSGGSTPIKVLVPCRSIYIMTQEARTMYKHGVFNVGLQVDCP